MSGVREKTCAAFFATQHFGFCERCLPQLTSQETCLLHTNTTSWHTIKHSLDLKQARESSENALALRRTNLGKINFSRTEKMDQENKEIQMKYLKTPPAQSKKCTFEI